MSEGIWGGSACTEQCLGAWEAKLGGVWEVGDGEVRQGDRFYEGLWVSIKSKIV